MGRSWPLSGRSWAALGSLLAALGPLLGRSWPLLGHHEGGLGRSFFVLLASQRGQARSRRPLASSSCRKVTILNFLRESRAKSSFLASRALKMAPVFAHRSPLDALGPLLAALGANLGSLGAILGRHWDLWGRSWGVIGGSWGDLGCPRGVKIVRWRRCSREGWPPLETFCASIFDLGI